LEGDMLRLEEGLKWIGKEKEVSSVDRACKTGRSTVLSQKRRRDLHYEKTSIFETTAALVPDFRDCM